MDRVLYFAQYVITEVDEEARRKAGRRLDDDLMREKTRLERATHEKTAEIEMRLQEALALTPDSAVAIYNLALLDLRQGAEDQAMTGFMPRNFLCSL